MGEITQALFATSRQGNVLVLMKILLIMGNLDVHDEKAISLIIVA